MNNCWSNFSNLLSNLGVISPKPPPDSTTNPVMSTQDRRPPTIRYTRNNSRRKTGLGVDLNVAPPSDNRDQEGTSTRVVSGVMPPAQSVASLTLAPIDVEALDDDVIISSPRAFAEAKNNSRRNRRRVIVVDVDAEDRSTRVTTNSRNKRRRVPTNQSAISGNTSILNLEGHSGIKATTAQSAIPQVKEPTFNCPVCMGALSEETSTKCGHIFCKVCIKGAISAQGKCPTCRRKITMKDTFRVYLPAAS